MNGIFNFYGNCGINSIIQIFLHTKYLLNILIQNNENNKPITSLFNKLLNSIKKLNSLQEVYYKFCHYLNYKIKISQNDHMYFCIKFIELLEEENCGKIIDLFSGIKKIKFENLKGFDEEKENFLFYIINLSKGETIENNVFKTKEIKLKDNNNEISPKIIYQKEIMIKEPEILMLNIECEISSYVFLFQIPESIKVNTISYKLYAINEYNNLHSIA